jgi:hypothetical protein
MPIIKTLTTTQGIQTTYNVLKIIPIINVDNVEFQRGPANVDLIFYPYVDGDAYHNGLAPFDRIIWHTQQGSFIPLSQMYVLAITDPTSPMYGGTYTPT